MNADHQARCDRLVADFARLRAAGAPIRLAKPTSNLFRRRPDVATLDVRAFDRVLAVDPVSLTADVEGMAPYDAVVDATLAHGFLPAVVPQLKSITVGGAVSGIGIESSSIRHGLVHETIEDLSILTGDGRIVECSRTIHPDLFYGFPNSYGTLGYALRLKIRLIPAAPRMHVRHCRFDHPAAFFRELAAAKAGYVDGVVFGPKEMVLTTADFTTEPVPTSDYTWRRIYYRSLLRRADDDLTTRDYIWRWDTDWFWCSKNVWAQNPLVRLLAGRRYLNSRTYQRVMRWAERRLPDRRSRESVIQDVDIPIHQAPAFLSFLLAEIPIRPIWICPFRAIEPFALYALTPGALYVNFGFWDSIPTVHEPGHYNRKVECKLAELDGKKGLYSTVWWSEAEFWRLYNGPAYRALKACWDPGSVFPDLWRKCAQGQ